MYGTFIFHFRPVASKRPLSSCGEGTTTAMWPVSVPVEGLKFDEASASGLGDKFGGRLPIGTDEFKKVETGHADTFRLTLDEAARKLLEGRLGTKGEIHLLIIPDDEGVAATYFGAGEEEVGRRPRLALKLASP
jgi:hypothetical protein